MYGSGLRVYRIPVEFRTSPWAVGDVADGVDEYLSLKVLVLQHSSTYTRTAIRTACVPQCVQYTVRTTVNTLQYRYYIRMSQVVPPVHIMQYSVGSTACYE